MTGQSAGGHLAALLATNETFLKDQGLKRVRDSRRDAHQRHLRLPAKDVATRDRRRPRRGGERASPLKHVSGKEPPFLILYADQDFTGCAAMSRSMHEALKAHAVESELVELKNRNHITIIFRPMFDEADPLVKALIGFVAEHSG